MYGRGGHGKGVCMTRGVHVVGRAWGVCMTRGMHGGVCMAGGLCSVECA